MPMGDDGNKRALEDLRSKIISSMNNGLNDHGRTVLPNGEIHSNKRQRNPYGNQSNNYRDGNASSRYVKKHCPSGPRSRYQFQQHQRRFTGKPPYSRYQGSNSSPNNTAGTKFREEDLINVVPINERKRMRPSRWDITPKGFENVPAERAKLSKLFPQPGRPHQLDRDKLEKALTRNGNGSRRTGILFEDADSNHLIFSKVSCKIIISGFTESIDCDHIKAYLEGFATSLEERYHLKSAVVQGPSHLVLEFNDSVCTTIVLSCRSFISRELGLGEGTNWRRPEAYVQQIDSPERLCGPEILAIENLKYGEERELIDHGLKVTFIKPIFTISKHTNERLFTGCALVELEKEPSNDSPLRWFKPNESHMQQSVSYMDFQGLVKLVREQIRVPSRVLLLMNLVDPLDLKMEEFAEEIEITLKSTLHKVESIRMNKPNADFRLNLEHIGDGVGNVYVKFQDLEAAELAMEKLPYKRFNGRNVICCYVSESDFELNTF